MKDYKKLISLVTDFIIVGAVLFAFDLFLMFYVISITQSTEYRQYEKLKAEYNKVLKENEDLIEAKKEALEKMKFAQDTWNQRQRRFSYPN